MSYHDNITYSVTRYPAPTSCYRPGPNGEKPYYVEHLAEAANDARWKRKASDVTITHTTEKSTCPYCERVFTPTGSQTVTCGNQRCQNDHKRALNRAKDKNRYKARPLKMRTCDYCKCEYNPTKFAQVTCGDAKCQAERRRARRDVA